MPFAAEMKMSPQTVLPAGLTVFETVMPAFPSDCRSTVPECFFKNRRAVRCAEQNREKGFFGGCSA